MPFHKDLRLAGLLPPVDAPHHMRVMEWKPYREGVVLRADPRTGSYVDVGLYDTVRVRISTRVPCSWLQELLPELDSQGHLQAIPGARSGSCKSPPTHLHNGLILVAPPTWTHGPLSPTDAH